MRLSLFDCNCMIGKRADRKQAEPWSLESLVRDMDHCGIAEALVTYAWVVTTTRLQATAS